ncbi:hypothetical protein H2201_009133 [Coniosporium apollinis]|uniref:Intradiol ring-cleavage dioxygenases domain-containing protein n=2 Tax=Coniosporium TaxID=2810619 RepID=A0ABQ9NEM1_9PEZI|nr:hypothetical protein H2199_008797 [Cladosporium sp. JES 115]KAJ9653538.1 hypothetical protein H2201_009133 [Coniosporium apollinis]
MRSVLLTVLFAFTAPFVSAHPGPHHLQTRSEIARRAELSKRCPGQAATFNALRQKRAVEKRSILSPHGSLAPRGINGTNVTIYTESPHYDTIQNDTCVLAPEIYAGPYLWPRSQTLRQDMSEDQAGVPLYLDIGVLNVNTCEPLPEVLVDLWHCNATGSYSSFTGRSPDTPFLSLLEQLNVTTGPDLDLHTDDTTFLRGLWPTDANGMMEMKTIFPGFYVQRSIHIHVQVHTNWTVRSNGTIVSSNTVNTGQLYFSEELSQQIVALDPYASHTGINRTTNAEDVLIGNSTMGTGFDPILDVVALDGCDVTKGMIGYITLGVEA